jgi:biopolymer transport protein ExbD
VKYALLKLRRSQDQAEPVTEVNIIPVIDISLVLLVILFVTAPLLSYPNLPVSLPKSEAPASDEATIAVTLTADGKLAVRSAEAGWDNLESMIRGELKGHPDATVLIRADRTVPYRSVQRILSASKAAGASSVAIGTEPNK